MNKKTEATKVFNEWAQNGKDDGMKRNHFASYQYIKKIIKDEFKNKNQLTLADIGCGSGWATGDLFQEEFINKACGYDGADKMVKKAQSTIQGPSFFCSNLNSWKPNLQFDIIYSMEVVYYLESPEKFIQNCFKTHLNPGGIFIAGIDHYQENKASLSWAEELNVEMQTKKINDWKNILLQNKFVNCNIRQVNQKDGWPGTLIFWGKKSAL